MPNPSGPAHPAHRTSQRGAPSATSPNGPISPNGHIISPAPALSGQTFVAMTHNLWGDHHAEDRTEALARMYRLRPPDLLATQELRHWSREVLDQVLPHHERVEDDFPGWEGESNLWWNTRAFSAVEHGTQDVGILAEHARLFWVRLTTTTQPERTLVFATAHLTWPGHPDERASGVNQRTPQAAAIVEALDELAGVGPCLFTLDINDIGGPLWELGNGGFLDTFTALGRHSPVTHPIVPDPFADGLGTRLSPIASPAKAIDWILMRGGVAARASEVVEYFHRGIAPSDHAPVSATLTFTD